MQPCSSQNPNTLSILLWWITRATMYASTYTIAVCTSRRTIQMTSFTSREIIRTFLGSRSINSPYRGLDVNRTYNKGGYVPCTMICACGVQAYWWEKQTTYFDNARTLHDLAPYYFRIHNNRCQLNIFYLYEWYTIYQIRIVCGALIRPLFRIQYVCFGRVGIKQIYKRQMYFYIQTPLS